MRVHWKEVQPDGAGKLNLAVLSECEKPLQQAMYSAALRALDVSGKVQSVVVSQEEFELCVAHLVECGFNGAAVEKPHKVAAAKTAERYWVARYSLGVANALKFENGVFAQNTEVEAMTRLLKDVPPEAALVMGAGSAARSAAMALLQLGWKVKVWSRGGHKARLLRTLFQRFDDLEILPQADPTGCRLVVNATPLGAKIGEIPPIQWQYGRPNMIFMDLVYRQVATDMLRTAALKGYKTIDGRELLAEQAALALEWWLSQTIPRDPLREAAGLKPKPEFGNF